MILKNIKNTAIFTFIGILPLVSSFLLLPFYTKYLSVATYSEFVLLLLYTFFAQLLINFGFDSSVSVYYFDFKNDKPKLHNFLTSAFTFQIFIFCMVLLFSVLVFHVYLIAPNLKFDIQFWPYGFLCILTALGSTFLKTYCNFLITIQDVYTYLRLNIVNFMLSMLLSMVGLLLIPDSLIGPISGRFIAYFISFITIVILIRKRHFGVFDFKIVKSVLPYNYPIVLFGLINWIMQNGDRYLILYLMSKKQVGVYDLSLKMALLIEFISSSVFLTVNPKLFQLYSEDKIGQSSTQTNKIYHSLTAFVILLISVNIFFVPLLLPYIIQNVAYTISMDLLVYVCLSYAMIYLPNMYINPIIFQKKTKLLPIIFTVNSVLKLTLSWILISYFQLYGAVFSLLIFRPIESLVYYLFTKNHYKFRFNGYKMIALPVLFVCVAIAIQFWLDCNFIVKNFLIMLEGFALVFIVFKTEILELLKSLFGKYFIKTKTMYGK